MCGKFDDNSKQIMYWPLFFPIIGIAHAYVAYQTAGGLVSDPVERTLVNGQYVDVPYTMIVHNYNTVPNIVCNIVNAVYGLGPDLGGGIRLQQIPQAQGVWSINGRSQMCIGV
jgi:hypothetical protein